jgi:hypothetical protein
MDGGSDDIEAANACLGYIEDEVRCIFAVNMRASHWQALLLIHIGGYSSTCTHFRFIRYVYAERFFEPKFWCMLCSLRYTQSYLYPSSTSALPTKAVEYD